MQKKLTKDYCLTASIHTIAIRTSDKIENVAPEITNCIASITQKQEDISLCIINPNKLMGTLYTYSEFKTALETILAGCGIQSYQLIRADMSFDSSDPAHYERYAKLNRYLISALATTYSIRNAYFTMNLFSHKQLSIAAKNRYFEIEHYDKNFESNGQDSACSRLELRSKDCRSNNLEREFIDRWFQRWDKAIKHLSDVATRYNTELFKLYSEQKSSRPVQFRTITDFICRHQQCIFTQDQLIDLFMRCENLTYDQAYNKARNHKKRNGIQFISSTEVRDAILEIKRASYQFFDN